MTNPKAPSIWVQRLRADSTALDSFYDYIHGCIGACNFSRDRDTECKSIEEVAMHHVRLSAKISAYRTILAYVNGQKPRGESHVALQTERGERDAY